jgi:hypothetical protein
MKKQSLLLVPLSVSLLMLSGCAGYNAKPLRSLIPETVMKNAGTRKKEGVCFSYKLFDTADCKKYLGRDVLKAGYQPIQITIVNKTNKEFLFSPYNLSVPCVSPEEVMGKVYTSTVSRAVGYGIGGLFIPILFIPAIVDSVWSCEANAQLDKDYSSKSANEQIIRPGATLNGVVFVAKGTILDDFTLTLLDIQANEQLVLVSGITSSFVIEE